MRADSYSLIQISISTALPDNHQSGSQLLMCEGLSEPSVFCSTPLWDFGDSNVYFIGDNPHISMCKMTEALELASSFLGFKSSGCVLF